MADRTLAPIDSHDDLWKRVFTVAPLVIVGSSEEDGSYDFAPKHMVTPVGPGRFFAFVCTPEHRTYHNVMRSKQFTATYVSVGHLLDASLAAAPRDKAGRKKLLESLGSIPAEKVDGHHVAEGSLLLECELERIVDGFENWSLIVGRVVHARADKSVYRTEDRDDADLVKERPILTYVHPGRWGKISRTNAFPYPWGFEH